MNCVNLVGTIYNKNFSEKVLKFSLGVYNSYKKETHFFNCVAFGKTKDLIEEYFNDKDQIGVTGSLQSQKYQEKTYVSILVNSISFINTKKGEKTQNEPPF